MRTVRLRGTDLSASRLGFGLSGLHHALTTAARQSLLSEAFACGITYFDTAPSYGHELAEQELGRFSVGRRQQLLIATKFGIQPNRRLGRSPLIMQSRLAANSILRRLTRRSDFVVQSTRDYTRASAVSSLERSLRNLRCDYVDVLFLHDPALELLNDADQLVASLNELQRQGKIRHLGLSGSAASCMEIAAAYPALAAVVQIDASEGERTLERIHESPLPLHATFGHFRGKAARVADSLAAAVRANRDGVILFSTRKRQRIRQMSDLLETLESA